MSRSTGSAWITSPKELGLRIRTFMKSPRLRTTHSLAVSQAFCQPLREACLENFLLGLGNIVIQTAELDRAFIQIVDDVGGFRIAIARLAHAADIHEVFLARFYLEFGIGAAPDLAITDESQRHVGVT